MNAFIKPCPFENMRDINRLVAVTYNFNVETIWMMLEQIKMIVFKKILAHKHSSYVHCGPLLMRRTLQRTLPLRIATTLLQI